MLNQLCFSSLLAWACSTCPLRFISHKYWSFFISALIQRSSTWRRLAKWISTTPLESVKLGEPLNNQDWGAKGSSRNTGDQKYCKIKGLQWWKYVANSKQSFLFFQAFNGALQSVPAIVVAFFAGPLSDRYARKPFILLSIAGYIILNAIFLINAYWFYELKVQLRPHHDQASLLISGRVPFVWMSTRHHRRWATLCPRHTGNYHHDMVYFVSNSHD